MPNSQNMNRRIIALFLLCALVAVHEAEFTGEGQKSSHDSPCFATHESCFLGCGERCKVRNFHLGTCLVNNGPTHFCDRYNCVCMWKVRGTATS